VPPDLSGQLGVPPSCRPLIRPPRAHRVEMRRAMRCGGGSRLGFACKRPPQLITNSGLLLLPTLLIMPGGGAQAGIPFPAQPVVAAT